MRKRRIKARKAVGNEEEEVSGGEYKRQPLKDSHTARKGRSRVEPPGGGGEQRRGVRRVEEEEEGEEGDRE